MGNDRTTDDPSTLLQHRYRPSPMPETTFRLLVTDGPDRGVTFTIDGSQPSRLFVGQSQVCDVCLHDPEISRRHAALEIEGRALHLVDLGSKNGTYVNRLKVADVWLEGGETVHVGSTDIRVECGAEAPRPSMSGETRFGRLLGASREMRRLYPLCERLATADVPVVIEGETGTGKEVLAESLHEMGPRKDGPFVVFDCTAVPSNLMESELFGHERGAFTGALTVRQGVFEQAHCGTLLVDEIGDLDPALQPKMLRAVERSEVRRIGGSRWIKVQVRLIAATRRDLDREVAAGRFRDDLYHRLAVGRIELPPLRRRRGDVAFLARHFVDQMRGNVRAVPSELLAKWEEYAWPGNVRELRNAVVRELALGDLGELDASEDEGGRGVGPGTSEHVADFIDDLLDRKLPLVQARSYVVAHFERRYVERVLAEHDGNVMRAAVASGVARRHFHRLKAKTKR